jgi:hypothetical protein
MEGIVGAGVTITPQVLERLRPSEISFNLAKHLLYSSFKDEEGFPKQHLFPQIQRLARRWIDEGYLVTKGVPIGAILYQDQLARASAKIDIACTRGSEGKILAILDPYNPNGSTRFVNFITSKPCWTTGARPPKCQISHVVLDSSWEEQLALTLENHPRVIAYAKNQAMGFEIPYLDAGVNRRYIPDFLVRLDIGTDEPLNTGEIRSDGAAGIAAWFIDTDYNEESFFVRHAYFLGANDPYKSLKTALKAEIDEDAWPALSPSKNETNLRRLSLHGMRVKRMFRRLLGTTLTRRPGSGAWRSRTGMRLKNISIRSTIVCRRV